MAATGLITVIVLMLLTLDPIVALATATPAND